MIDGVVINIRVQY